MNGLRHAMLQREGGIDWRGQRAKGLQMQLRFWYDELMIVSCSPAAFVNAN
jgi:hypothetical protein